MIIDSVTAATSGLTSGADAINPATTRGASLLESGETQGADFGTVLGQMLTNATNVLKTAEATSIAGVQGQATVQKVVEAIMAAEQTLQGALAIRDKVISAYQDLSRMSI
jgi:flagellar hook-basal body complex protein FliE